MDPHFNKCFDEIRNKVSSITKIQSKQERPSIGEWENAKLNEEKKEKEWKKRIETKQTLESQSVGEIKNDVTKIKTQIGNIFRSIKDLTENEKRRGYVQSFSGELDEIKEHRRSIEQLAIELDQKITEVMKFKSNEELESRIYLIEEDKKKELELKKKKKDTLSGIEEKQLELKKEIQQKTSKLVERVEKLETKPKEMENDWADKRRDERIEEMETSLQEFKNEIKEIKRIDDNQNEKLNKLIKQFNCFVSTEQFKTIQPQLDELKNNIVTLRKQTNKLTNSERTIESVPVVSPIQINEYDKMKIEHEQTKTESEQTKIEHERMRIELKQIKNELDNISRKLNSMEEERIREEQMKLQIPNEDGYYEDLEVFISHSDNVKNKIMEMTNTSQCQTLFDSGGSDINEIEFKKVIERTNNDFAVFYQIGNKFFVWVCKANFIQNCYYCKMKKECQIKFMGIAFGPYTLMEQVPYPSFWFKKIDELSKTEDKLKRIIVKRCFGERIFDLSFNGISKWDGSKLNKIHHQSLHSFIKKMINRCGLIGKVVFEAKDDIVPLMVFGFKLRFDVTVAIETTEGIWIGVNFHKGCDCKSEQYFVSAKGQFMEVSKNISLLFRREEILLLKPLDAFIDLSTNTISLSLPFDAIQSNETLTHVSTIRRLCVIKRTGWDAWFICAGLLCFIGFILFEIEPHSFLLFLVLVTLWFLPLCPLEDFIGHCLMEIGNPLAFCFDGQKEQIVESN